MRYPNEGETVVTITNALASVTVKDLAKSVAWYQTLFRGRPIPPPCLAKFG